ncbi:MAG: dUTP diphosphatase [Ignavibacteriae bacterium]|jgi:dUTP pyrophosphatase|nr:dUTP diphosphatase [Ignavibacteriota bacterium]
MNIRIKFTKYNPEEEVFIPKYATNGSAGMDLCSSSRETVDINPGEIKLVNTNLILEIPAELEGQVRPRSGLALKHGITVLNSPGTIDSDYRGEVKVLLINHGKHTFRISCGDRIAQLIIAKHERADLYVSDNLAETERGTGGYGSTGTKS